MLWIFALLITWVGFGFLTIELCRRNNIVIKYPGWVAIGGILAFALYIYVNSEPIFVEGSSDKTIVDKRYLELLEGFYHTVSLWMSMNEAGDISAADVTMELYGMLDEMANDPVIKDRGTDVA